MRNSHALVATLFGLSLLFNAGVSSAQDKPSAAPATDAARQHFQQGVALFRERNFRAALVEFQRANETSPNWRLLYNIGQTYAELHEYPEAIQAFQQYVAQGGAEIDKDRKAEVDAEVQKLRHRVARLAVTTSVPGAEVLVDERVLGTTPLQDPLVVGVGRRKIEARKKGFSVAMRTLDLAAGDDKEVALTLVEETTAPVAAGAMSTTGAVAPAPRKNSGVWIGLTATGILAAGTAITGVLALSARSDFRQQVDTYPGSSSAIDDARNKTKTMALVTDVLGGATLIAGAVTVYLALRPSSAGNEAPAKVDVALGARSAALRVRF